MTGNDINERILVVVSKILNNQIVIMETLSILLDGDALQYCRDLKRELQNKLQTAIQESETEKVLGEKE